MNNFLLLIAAILVLILTALFAVPPMINWNDFRYCNEVPTYSSNTIV